MTFTFRLAGSDAVPSKAEIGRRCRLFLSCVNRRLYGRHGTRRQGLRIGSVAFMGTGAYGTHPHVHWALAGPSNLQPNELTEILRQIASTTLGIGQQFDIQTYYGVRWLKYMLDHGFEGWIEQVTFAAKCPMH